MTRTVVVGAGVAGLVAARAAALRGDEVTMLDPAQRAGGSVASVEVAGLRLDSGAESFAVRGAEVADLCGALGLEVVPPAESTAWLRFGDDAAPLPAAGVLGIPGAPLAEDVRRIIGTRGAARAWLDRVLPELHIGRERNLGALVRRRMGRRVLDLLVRPVVRGVYGLDPDEADVDALVPGLNGALTRTGALSSAVLSLRAASPAGAAVSGIRGGMHRLVEALLADLREREVSVRLGVAALSIERGADSWTVVTAEEPLAADRLVLATDGGTARSLLASVLGEEDGGDPWPGGRSTLVVTVVADEPALDAAPHGTGVLVADAAPRRASALTHSSAKWPWLRDVLPEGRHVLRLTYPGDAAEPDRAAIARDLTALSGVRVDESAVVGTATTRWRQDPPRALLGVRERTHAILERVGALEDVSLTGAWVAGTGLAAVVRHAQAVGLAR